MPGALTAPAPCVGAGPVLPGERRRGLVRCSGHDAGTGEWIGTGPRDVVVPGVVRREKAGDDLRTLQREITPLAGVRHHVVELVRHVGGHGVLPEAGLVGQLPPTFVDRDVMPPHRHVPAVRLDDQRPIARNRASRIPKPRSHADAVQAKSFRRLEIGEIEQRRKDVDVRRQDRRLARRQRSGLVPERHRSDATFTDLPLGPAKRTDEPRPRGTVVGQEQDDRVLGDAETIDGRKEASDVVVDVLDHREDATRPIDPLRRRLAESVEDRRKVRRRVVIAEFFRDVVQRIVRRVRRDVGEERTFRGDRPFDELDARLELDVGAVALRRDKGAVSEHDRVGVAPLVLDGLRRLGESAAAMHQGLVEPLIDRPHRIRVAEVPLAEDASDVPRVAQDLREGDLLRLHLGTADVGVERPGPLGVSPGQERCAGRRAHRADVEARKPRAPGGHAVEVGGAEDGIPGESEVAVALIVGHDHHDVRRGRRLGEGDEEDEDQGRHRMSTDHARKVVRSRSTVVSVS